MFICLAYTKIFNINDSIARVGRIECLYTFSNASWYVISFDRIVREQSNKIVCVSFNHDHKTWPSILT